MSSMPPPPPPLGYAPGPGQGGFDRRAWRAQRKAADRQVLLEAAQRRQLSRAARRNSLVGPLLLLSLGTMLLLLQTGRLHWSDALAWLGRWWPAILIAAGLVMVIEWVLDRSLIANDGTPLAPRRTLGGGATTLLILLALVGAGAMIAENGSLWARRNLDQRWVRNGFGDWREVFGEHAVVTEDMQAPLGSDGTLTIDDPRGDITVTGSSDDGKVHVSIQRHIYGWQHSEVAARQRMNKPSLTGGPAHLLLTAPSQDQDDADLTVQVPHDAALTIRSSHGDVQLEELRGALNVMARDGDVKLTALRGPVHLETQDDNATITAHSIAGEFTLNGRSGDINLSDIDGAVALHGDFFGTTHLERIRGAVHFQSSFTDFACAAIPGDLNVEGRSDLDAHRLEGPVTIITTNRNLTLDGVRGGGTVDDRNGSITLSLAGPLEPLHVSDANGTVEVSVAADRGFALDARTENGQIENDFGLGANRSGTTTTLQGRVGSGGPAVTLQTTQGDITVRRSSAETSADWGDTPARLTPVPVHRIRP